MCPCPSSFAFAVKRVMSSSVQIISARCPLRYNWGMFAAALKVTLPRSRPNSSKARKTAMPMSAPRGVEARESRQATTFATMRGSFHTASGVSPHFSSMRSSAEPQVFFVDADRAVHSGLDERAGSSERHCRISETNVVGSGDRSCSRAATTAFTTASLKRGLAGPTALKTQGPPLHA